MRIPVQEVTREEVREIFPSAPDRCVDCPALRNAAHLLLASISELADVATNPSNSQSPAYQPDPVENITEQIITGHGARMSRLTDERLKTYPVIASELYDWHNCGHGPIPIKKFGPKYVFNRIVRRQRIIDYYCGSVAPLAGFVGHSEIRSKIRRQSSSK